LLSNPQRNPRPAEARNPQRQGGSHYGEGAREDHREGDGGSTAISGETVIRVSRLYVEVSLVFDFIVWEYFLCFLDYIVYIVHGFLSISFSLFSLIFFFAVSI